MDKSTDDFRRKFLVKLERKETFHCFCDRGKCLTRKKYSKSDAIHSLLWPGLYLIIYIVGLLIWIVPLKCECRNPFHICKRHSISSGECGDVRYSLSSGDIRHTCPYCRTIFSKAESLEGHQRNCGSDLIKKEFKGLETSC